VAAAVVMDHGGGGGGAAQQDAAEAEAAGRLAETDMDSGRPGLPSPGSRRAAASRQAELTRRNHRRDRCACSKHWDAAGVASAVVCR